MISKIERIKLRDVWKHEALDFTTWLEENVDALNDVLDFSLVNAEREQKAGIFSVDLVAEDENGNVVIIENQLEKSNHDHLGKVITYLVGMEAKTAIWIVSDPQPEHVKAIAWLNESSSASFYLLKIEAIKIGESEPAPLLTHIVGPSQEAREVGKTKKEIAERYTLRYEFWKQLLEQAKKRTKLHATISPRQYSWVGSSAGINGLNFNYNVRQHDAQVELYIDRDKESGEGNKEIFDLLLDHKEQIEQEFGEPLLWERLDQKRASRIRKTIERGGYKDDDKWSEVHEAMIETMIRFEHALRSHIDELKSKLRD
jgi:hypothetical protein